MSYSEFLDWIAFRNSRGPLDGSLRIEKTLALIATIFATGTLHKKGAGKWTMDDFTVYTAPEVEKELTPEAALQLLKGLSRGK
jgi:hypothetical protein